jgi:probable rRNA maturation factor
MVDENRNAYGKQQVDVDLQVEDSHWLNDVPQADHLIQQAILETLLFVGFSTPCGISVLLTTDLEVQALNKEFRHQDKPTNILSFPSLDPEEIDLMMEKKPLNPPSTAGLFTLDEPLHLGDLALAYETLAREAMDQKKAIENHLIHLVIHGTLHLLGYDHMTDEEAEHMEALEIDILKTKFNIENPYSSVNSM